MPNDAASIHTASTLTEVLTRQARRVPNAPAYTFLRDGEEIAETITFAELHTRARAVAARLAALGNPGDRALLVYPSGLEFFVAFFGCLYAGIIAIPVSMPHRTRGLGTVRGIIGDSGAKWILCAESVDGKLEHDFADEPLLAVMPRFITDEWRTEPKQGWVEPTITPDHVALLQYTSGSTGSPRGVIVTHRNLAHNQQSIATMFGLDERTVVLSWLPMFHDMGLGSSLGAVWLGVHCVLMSPSAFVERPFRWLQAISRFRATYSGGPDFAFDLAARRVSDEQLATLDLSSWTVAFNGSEPIRAATLDMFVETFSKAGFTAEAFRPCYGLAEATLVVSGEPPGRAPIVDWFDRSALELGELALRSRGEGGQPLVSCGPPVRETRVAIIDPDTHKPSAPGHIGEIWLASPAVAAGYWNKPAETAETFGARTADGDGPFLRTGDLGFLRNGRVYIAGRLKDLIIIRGLNHYPQDIEATVSTCHPALEPQRCAAFSVQSAEGEKLVVVQEVKRTAMRKLDLDEVFRAIRSTVSRDHSLQTHAIVLLRPSRLPRTSSGKVQRKACRQGFLDGTLAEVAAWTTDGATQVELAEDHGTSRERADRLIWWLRDYAAEHAGVPLRDVPSLSSDLGKQGVFGMQVAPRHGGLGLGDRDALRVLEQVAAFDLNVALFISVNGNLGLRPIELHASEAQKQAFLPQLASGQLFAGFGFAQPTEHAAQLQVRAEPDAGDEKRWRISGALRGAGVAASADVFPVFAPLPERSDMTGFLLRAGMPGLRAANARAAGSGIVLDQVLVTSAELLGAPGKGAEVAADALDRLRLAMAAVCLGGLKRTTQLAVDYAVRSPGPHGKRLIAHPVTLARLGPMTAGISAIECLIDSVARALDGGQALGREAFLAAKIIAPDLLWQAVDDLIQIIGEQGDPAMLRVPELHRDARFLRIVDGSTESVASALGVAVFESLDGIRALMTDVFEVPYGAAWLEGALQAVRGRAARLPHQDGGSARDWANLRAGQLAAWGILLGAVDGARRKESTPQLERAVAWVRGNYEKRLAAVQGGTPSEAITLGPSAITDTVAAFSRSIGELTPAARESAAVAEREAPESRPSSKVPAAAKADELQAWVISWLSRRLRIPASEIDPRRSFADHSLDSLAAVELTKALGEKLGVTLDETLLWNFATIEALIGHLTHTDPAPPRERPSASEGSAALAEPELTTELDEEIARLELEIRRRS